MAGVSCGCVCAGADGSRLVVDQEFSGRAVVQPTDPFCQFLAAIDAEPELDDELSLLLLEELLLELLFAAVSFGTLEDDFVLGSLSRTTLWPDVGPSISISEAKGSGSSRLSDESMTTVSVFSRRAAASASFTALLIVAGSGEIPGAGMRGGVLSMMCLWLSAVSV